MDFIVFITVYPLILLLSRLPMTILYFLSDFLFFVMYYLVGYRKKVVIENINLAFPDKKEDEKKKIVKGFYKHFVDLLFESIKSFSITENELKKRYKFKNVELINDLFEKGKSIMATSSHLNNWELAFGMPLVTPIKIFSTYTKLNNKYFEKYIKKSRTRFGGRGVPTFEFKKEVENRVKNNIQTMYVLLSDQSPMVSRTKYWGTFLGKFVPVHTGAELLAKKYDLPMVNWSVTKVKRGYYEAEFELITEDVRSYDDFELTDKYLRITEANIRKQPENYLWSHKRFKHMGRYDEWLASRRK